MTARERIDNGAVVYLPGGLYVAGPVPQQWNWLGEIQRRTNLATALISYCKPAQHPHPAALDDAVVAIRALHRSGELIDGRWILAGGSGRLQAGNGWPRRMPKSIPRRPTGRS